MHTLTKLDPYLTALMFAIILFEILGAISNIICIYIVRKTKRSNLITRPKLLMANIALGDTLLMIVTIIPRFLILNVIVNDYPLMAHIIQCIRSYLENISLHVEAITMTVVACDRYFSLKRVFINPFDKWSSKLIIGIIWTISTVFSLPFLVNTDIDYWNYTTLSVECIRFNSSNEDGDILFFDTLMKNDALVRSTRVVYMLVEFIIPTLVVIFFSAKIVIRLFDLYMTSGQRVRSSASVVGCEITKRLVFILFIFIMKNTAFILVTGRWSQVFSTFDYPCPTSIHSGKLWFFLYEVYRITTTVNSFIYFWLSQDFRDQCRMFLFRCISSRSAKKSVQEQTIKIVQF